MAQREPSMVVRPVSPLPDGERIQHLRLDDGQRSVSIGRTSSADWTVPHLSISRNHAILERAADGWHISDAGSKHGTFVNGQRLEPGERLPLRPGDEIRLGAWMCRCDTPHAPTSRLTSIADEPRTVLQTVRRVDAADLAGVAQKRLDALIDASRQLGDAADRTAVADILARSAAAGSGCSTAVVVRPVGEGAYEQLAPADADHATPLSRTLLEAALEGEVVLLRGGADQFKHAQSIIELGITSALCAPIMIGGFPDSLLYLDSRSTGASISDDTATFCRALAQLGAGAIERQLARELANRREQLERDLDSARRAQQLLMPPRAGVRGRVSYCSESIPGRFVAGDLFDILDLPGGRTSFFLGDVSGKGAAASLLMAAAQAHLRAALAQGAPLAECLASANRFVHEHTETRTFITMIAGVFDPASSSIELADAGHGLCCLCPVDAPPARPEVDGGLPIGVDPDHRYGATTITIPADARLVLFSDGLVEQTNDQGEQFGFDRTLAALAGASSPEDDVRTLTEAVRAHADGPLADDLTIVSLRFGPG